MKLFHKTNALFAFCILRQLKLYWAKCIAACYRMEDDEASECFQVHAHWKFINCAALYVAASVNSTLFIKCFSSRAQNSLKHSNNKRIRRLYTIFLRCNALFTRELINLYVSLHELISNLRHNQQSTEILQKSLRFSFFYRT